ncbi:MAG: dihydroneopterin aldolase [Armatimonadota bacterium]
MDKIHIRDIALHCVVGIFEHERHQKQDVLISATLHSDLRKAGQTDDFENAIDYMAVERKITDLVEGSSYFLVEALAEAVANACLEFDGVERVDVIVEKPGASKNARVTIEISRALGS